MAHTLRNLLLLAVALALLATLLQQAEGKRSRGGSSRGRNTSRRGNNANQSSASAQAGSTSSTLNRENKKGKENVTKPPAIPKQTSNADTQPSKADKQQSSKVDEKKQTAAAESHNPYEKASAPATPGQPQSGVPNTNNGGPGHIGWNPELSAGTGHYKPNSGVPPNSMNMAPGMGHQGYSHSPPMQGMGAVSPYGMSGAPPVGMPGAPPPSYGGFPGASPPTGMGGTYPGNMGMASPPSGIGMGGVPPTGMGMSGHSAPGMGMGGAPPMGMGGVPPTGMGMGGMGSAPPTGMGMPQPAGMGMNSFPQGGMGGIPQSGMGGPPNGMGMGSVSPGGMGTGGAPYGNMGGNPYGGMASNPSGMSPYGMGNMGSAFPAGHHSGVGHSGMLGGLGGMMNNNGYGKPHSKGTGVLPMLGAAGVGAIVGAGLGAGVGYQSHKMMHGMKSRLGDSDEDLIDADAEEMTSEPETGDNITTVDPEILVDTGNPAYSTTAFPAYASEASTIGA